MINKYFLILCLFFVNLPAWAQTYRLTGKVISQSKPVEFANVVIMETGEGTITDLEGNYSISIPKSGFYTIQVARIGYRPKQKNIKLIDSDSVYLVFDLEPIDTGLDEIVVTGTMQEVSRLDSPVPVEVYKSGFFRANPSPSIFESLQQINGVRPQINCNICNTGDIHVNGLEGPYTMVLIDGMPIVSGLATVYGLTGIPQAMIDRIELVKGPASTLYGSEAVGGLINVITKKPENSPRFILDGFGTSWKELNLDMGFSSDFGKKLQSLTGLNVFHYANPIDANMDGFTDLTLSKRFSIFQKLNLIRPDNKIFNLAGRYVYEDRWGGEMLWRPLYRGGDQVYGESIFTKRWETFGTWQLPSKENLNFQFSANGHLQNSVYGTTFYIADQYVGFGQLTWIKNAGSHNFLMGSAYRYTYYDDNTPATSADSGNENQPSVIHLPGLFVQDEISLSQTQRLLIGNRLDFNSKHGLILSPRVNYKISSLDKSTVFRFSAGNGFRVANVFTEDHAALTGAREVIFEETLKPEQSWNINSNFVKKIYTNNGTFLGLDASAFYTFFKNRILPDYETNPNQIIYSNLNGSAVSKGISVNLDLALVEGLTVNAGATWMDVTINDEGIKTRQVLTERFSGVWSVGYELKSRKLKLDYTGNLYSPMRLPLLGELDDRPANSPWWSIQNIQVTQQIGTRMELYGGVKNLLNFMPPANSIARPFDPFDRNVVFAPDGSVVATPDNPNALTFDPTYVFAPNQGIRGFLGIRYTISN
jgi:outer membrane receptor for ferrienterochelin and colicins